MPSVYLRTSGTILSHVMRGTNAGFCLFNKNKIRGDAQIDKQIHGVLPNHHVPRYRLEGERRRTFKQPSQPALSSDGDGRVCLMCGWGLSTFHPILEYHHIGSRYPPRTALKFSHALSGFRNTKITRQTMGARRKTKTDSVLRLYRSRVQRLDELNTVF